MIGFLIGVLYMMIAYVCADYLNTKENEWNTWRKLPMVFKPLFITVAPIALVINVVSK